MADLVVVARFSTRPEAVVAQSLLRSAGIETLMPDFNVLMADFDPSMMESGWRLMVCEDDAADARELLAHARDATDAA